MKKTFLTFLIALTCISTAFTQNLSDEEAVLSLQEAEFKSNGRFSGPEKLIPHNSDEFLLLHYNYEGAAKQPHFFLESYDGELKMKQRSFLEFADKKGSRVIEDVFYFNDKLYVLTVKFSKEQNAKLVCANVIDQSTLKVTNEETVLATVSFKGVSKSFKIFVEAVLSEDKSQMLLMYNDALKALNRPFKLNIAGFDRSLKKQWGINLVTTEYGYYDSELQGVITNSGEAYVRYHNKKATDQQYNQTDKKFKYSLFRIKNNGDVVEKVLKPENKTVLASRLFLEGDVLRCAGIYQGEGAGGVFVFEPDFSTNEISNYNFINLYEANEAFAGNDYADLDKLMEDWGYLRIQKITRLTTGQLILITERYYYRQSDYSISNFDNIYTFYFDDEDQLDHVIQIEKDQHTAVAEVSSFYHVNVGDREYYLFNDNLKNSNSFTGETYDNEMGEKPGILLLEVGENGEQVREVVIKKSSNGMIYMPVNSISLSADKVIIIGGQSSKAGLLKITLAR